MRRVRTHPPRPGRPSWAGLLCALLLLGAPGPAGGAEPPPEAQLAVAWVTRRHEVYEGEVLPLALRVRVSEAWLVQHGVPFARQPMDLPLRVRAPALRGSSRLTPLAPEADAPGHPVSLALDDEVVADARWGGVTEVGPHKGEPARTVERWITIRRAFQVRGAEPLVLEAPEVDVVWAQRFQAGLLGERIPVEPLRATVRGEPLSLQVLPLPEVGRPAAFEGWIGRYRLDAQAGATTLAAGEPLRVTLTLAGEGNHAVLPAPRLPAPPGWHVAGRLERRTHNGWNIQLELEPAEPRPHGLGPFELFAFDPEARTYVRTASPPVAVALEAREEPPASAPPQEPSKPPAWRTWLAIAALALILGVTARRRRRRAEPAAEAQAAASTRRTALARLGQAAGTPGAAAALVDVLALHLGVSPAAVIAPDLAARLERAGLAPDLARDVARAVEADVAARYAGPAGGAEAPVSAALAARVIEALGQDET